MNEYAPGNKKAAEYSNIITFGENVGLVELQTVIGTQVERVLKEHGLTLAELKKNNGSVSVSMDFKDNHASFSIRIEEGQ